MPAKIAIHGLTVENSKEGDRDVAIVGYTGREVDLRDYGFPEPLVYNLQGFTIPNHIPYSLEHGELLGHTIKNSKDGEKITHIATHAVKSDISDKVLQELQAGERYEASMDAEFAMQDVVYIANGTVEVNNRVFNAPIFVANKGRITEITATKSGRDPDTRVTKLSNDHQEGKELLMKVKNSKSANQFDYLDKYKDNPKAVALIENAKKDNWDEDMFKKQLAIEPTSTPPSQEYLLDHISDPDAVTLIENARKEKWDEAKFKVELLTVKNSNAQPHSFDYLFDYLGDDDAKVLIQNARKEKWDEDKFKREYEVTKIKNSYKGVPGIHIADTSIDNGYTARLALSLGLSEKMIETKLGKKALDYAGSQGMMGLKEGLMLCANANGGRFNGHSDEQALAKHIKMLVRNSAFSTIDFPNLMHQVTMWKLEEKWDLDEPQAPSMCKTITSKDFKKTGHIKPRGGKMWEGFNQEGKITHGTMGKEDKYETELSTLAQIVTFKREDIINDDIGWIEEALDLMLEGAMMVPDYQLVNLIYGAETAGVLNTSGVNQNLFALTLTEANLKTVYEAIRRRRTTKESADGEKLVNGRFNTRWDLVVGPNLEEAAWNIIKQDRIVSNTAADTKQGDKNYWFNRLDIKTFDNLDNDTYHPDAVANAWMLLPQRDTYMPFYINYLNRQVKPVTETVDLPADELGFGVRGYWDVNLGYRPVENNKLQAFALSIPE